jgi:plastocyanin
MARDTSTPTDETNSTLKDWSRRTVLKVTGGSLAVGGLGGATVVGASEQDDENGEGENDGDGGEEGGDDSNFLEDLIDPTWGYPLAADETGKADVETVVQLVTEEGEGAHENFPRDPESGETFPFEFYFDPVGVRVHPDQVLHFLSAAGEHTVTAFHEKFSIPMRPIPNRIPEGVVGFTSPPIVDGESWLYQFPKKGVYDLFCLPHLAPGMVMRVVVFDPEADDIESETFATPSSGELPPSAQRVYDAEELDPANIVEEGPVAWEELTLASE